MKKILFFYMLVLPAIGWGQNQASSWQVFYLGTPAIAINLPGKPEPMETTLSPLLLQIISGYYSYHYEDPHTGVVVMLFHVSFTEEILPDVMSSSDQMIKELESRGAKNIRYSSVSIDIDGRKGMRQSGTLKMNDIKQRFTTILLAEGPNEWKIVAYAKARDRRGQTALLTILNSITF